MRERAARGVLSKPLKFAMSIALLLFSMWLLLPALEVAAGTREALWTLLVVTMAIEMGVIVVQALRGERSHFNTTTSLNRLGWALMMAAIVVASLVFVVIAVFASIRPLSIERPSLVWAVRLGLWLLASSAVSGFAMGGRNQHAVGGPDDAGEALPIVGWSARFGDLRVSHFVSLHALQLLVVAAVIAAPLGETFAVVVVVGLGTGAALLSIATLAQALRGRPLVPIRPGAR